MSLDVSGASAGGVVAFMTASERGVDAVPGGGCVGTPLDLLGPTLAATIAVDGNGDLQVEPTLPSTACGRFVQLLDLTTCETSQVTQLSAVQVLAVTGDVLELGAVSATITEISGLTVNSSGEWLVQVDTDAVDPETSAVLLKNGAELLREGDTLTDLTPLPPFSDQIDAFDSLTLNDTSRSALTFCFDGPDGIPEDSCLGTFEFDSGVFLDSERVASEGQSGGGFIYSTIREAKINKDNDILVSANLDPPLDERALVFIDEIDGDSDLPIVRVGETRLGRTIEDLKVGPHGYGFNDLDQVLFVGDLVGSPSDDTFIFLEPQNALLAREGTTSPNSKAYADMSGTLGARVDLNSSGAAAFIAPTEGDCCSDVLAVPLARTTLGCTPEPEDEVLVLDPDPTFVGDEVLVAEIGDEFPVGSGQTICGFGTPVYLDDQERVIYSVQWNDPDECPSALVRYANGTNDIVVEAGDTVVIDGVDAVIENLCGTEFADERRCYGVSPDGEFIGLRVTLTDGREAALLLSL